jgi:hypothetical protein
MDGGFHFKVDGCAFVVLAGLDLFMNARNGSSSGAESRAIADSVGRSSAKMIGRHSKHRVQVAPPREEHFRGGLDVDRSRATTPGPARRSCCRRLRWQPRSRRSRATACRAAPPAGGRLRREFAGAVGGETQGATASPRSGHVAVRDCRVAAARSEGGGALFRQAAPGRAGLAGALAPVQARLRPRLGGSGLAVRTGGGGRCRLATGSSANCSRSARGSQGHRAGPARLQALVRPGLRRADVQHRRHGSRSRTAAPRPSASTSLLRRTHSWPSASCGGPGGEGLRGPGPLSRPHPAADLLESGTGVERVEVLLAMAKGA